MVFINKVNNYMFRPIADNVRTIDTTPISRPPINYPPQYQPNTEGPHPTPPSIDPLHIPPDKLTCSTMMRSQHHHTV